MTFEGTQRGRAGDARYGEEVWRKDALDSSARYNEVKAELEKLNEQLNEAFKASTSKELTEADKNLALETNAKLMSKIQAKEEQLKELEGVVRKAGKNPNNPTAQ